MTTTTDWASVERKVFFQTGRRTPVTLVRGEGSYVYDEAGKRYLDFVAGIAVVSIGHSHPLLVDAIKRQAETLIHVSNLYYTVPQLQLAELLVQHSCLDRVYFCNSGAEAIEGALKLARKWGGENRDGAYEIISALQGFHGRTLGAVTATGTERYKAPYGPLMPGFINVAYDDIQAIKDATTNKTCAVLLEPIQGEGGVNIPASDYLRAVREWCDEKGILLILDEIQTGVGRTGTLWAYEQAGIEPDIMTLAKGLAGGVPIGALLAKEKVAGTFQPGDHGSTFGGNPLATAAGYAVLKHIIDTNLPAQVQEKGERLVAKLRGLEDRHGVIAEVRGRGLLCAVQFDQDIAEEVVRTALEEGLLLNNLRPNVLRIAPPLTISDEEIDEAVAALDRVLTKRAAASK
ncbi:MAG: acetylornithine transaminase [Chloroflexi bacterium]|nr:acetylornithine transaminase [Chloroflexota bacterium]